MPITNELATVYSSAPKSVNYVETLEFSHSNFPFSGGVFYMTNHFKAFTGKSDDNTTDITFEPLPFTLTLPKSDGGGNQDLNIGISNVGRDLVDAIEAANSSPIEPIIATFRVYLDPGDGLNQIDPFSLAITDISIAVDYVTAIARRADVLNALFPSYIYRANVFPGLSR